MTKLKYCLYSWRQYIAFRMYVGFRFDKIWCISTKLRICIRNVCILERIQNLIFGDSESFSSKGIYGPHTWQHKKYVLCPSMIYCLYDVYWVHILPDMVHINKTQDMYRKCPYSRKNQNSIFEDSWSFRPVLYLVAALTNAMMKLFVSPKNDLHSIFSERWLAVFDDGCVFTTTTEILSCLMCW